MKYFAINSQSYINRKEDSLSSYFHDISKYPVLSPEDELQVAADIMLGGEIGKRAKNTLICSNLRFVVSVANKYVGRGVSLADLIQEGNMGLVEAVRSYDPSQDYRFLTYAVSYILKNILSILAENASCVKIPSNKRRIVNAFQKTERQNPSKSRYELIEDFCQERGYNVFEFERILAASSKAKEADAPICDDEDCNATFIDLMPSANRTDAAMDYESMHADLMRAIDTVLDPREKKVITEFYGIGCEKRTINAIGKELVLKYEGTRKIRERALKKLTSSRIFHQLSGYLAA